MAPCAIYSSFARANSGEINLQQRLLYISYLQMSHFSFPDTPIILKGTVNDNGKYFTTHKLVCKNLQTPLHNYKPDYKLFFY